MTERRRHGESGRGTAAHLAAMLRSVIAEMGDFFGFLGVVTAMVLFALQSLPGTGSFVDAAACVLAVVFLIVGLWLILGFFALHLVTDTNGDDEQ